MSGHQCVLPWGGVVHQCTCGRGFVWVVFHDDDIADTWSGWEPAEDAITTETQMRATIEEETP